MKIKNNMEIRNATRSLELKLWQVEKDFGMTQSSFNLLLEALAIAQLNKAQKSICLFILCRTYGCNRNEDAISLSEFADACGTTRGYISKQMNIILKKKIIHRLAHNPGKTSVYSIEPCLDKWSPDCIDLELLEQNRKHAVYEASQSIAKELYECTFFDEPISTDDEAADQLHLSSNRTTVDQQLSSNPTTVLTDKQTTALSSNRTTVDKQLSSNSTTVLVDKQTTVLSSNRATVDHNSALEPPVFEASLKKELKKEKERRIYSEDSIEFELSKLLLTKILQHIPGLRIHDLQKCKKEMDLMTRLDKRPGEETREVILFAQNDLFWQNNILSPSKLRKQYDTLNCKRMASRGSPSVGRYRKYDSDRTNSEEADEYN